MEHGVVKQQIYLFNLHQLEGADPIKENNFNGKNGRHTGKITLLKYFCSEQKRQNYIISASEDKSIRLWSIDHLNHKLIQICVLMSSSYPFLQCLTGDIWVGTNTANTYQIKFIGIFSNFTIKLIDLTKFI